MNIFRKVYDFYVSGFKEMTTGKILWAIILIKLFVMFFVLKLFFFKNALSEYDTPHRKSQRVIENLVTTDEASNSK